MQSSTLAKDTPFPVLAVEGNPIDIFQAMWQHLQGNLCCTLQLGLLLELANADIKKNAFSATLEVILNMLKHKMYK